jgi:hypothetical protein
MMLLLLLVRLLLLPVIAGPHLSSDCVEQQQRDEQVMLVLDYLQIQPQHVIAVTALQQM